MSEELGKDVDGLVVDEEKARRTPCKCMKFVINGKEIELCWSPGIIGILTEEQKRIYCPKKIYKEPSEKMKRRLELFAKVSKKLSGIPLEERLKLMSKMLKEKE